MISSRQLARGFACLLPLSLCLRLVALGVAAEDLTPRWTEQGLQVAAPRVDFLSGKLLERLHNGAAVPFDLQLTVSNAGSRNIPLQRAIERFVVSYDLWEEKFSVVRLRTSRRGSHLTAKAAEAWCLENLALPLTGVGSDQKLWVRLEIRSAEAKALLPLQDEAGLSMTALIELFSRPVRHAQEHWVREAGPFRAEDLRR